MLSRRGLALKYHLTNRCRRVLVRAALNAVVLKFTQTELPFRFRLIRKDILAYYVLRIVGNT